MSDKFYRLVQLNLEKQDFEMLDALAPMFRELNIKSRTMIIRLAIRHYYHYCFMKPHKTRPLSAKKR